MSRPIYEPSLPRADQALAWGSRQLFRRPSPTVPRGWGIPDLVLTFGVATIPDNTHFPIPWADFATPHDVIGAPTTPFQIEAEGVTLFDVDITDTGDAGNDRFEITTVAEGWWANEMITGWDQVSTPGTSDIAGVAQRVYFSSGTGFPFDPINWRDSSDWMIAGAIGGSIVSFGFADDGFLRTWVAPHFIPANKTWLSTGIQTTGVSRGLSGVKWAWWYIGDDTISVPGGWTFGNVFD